MSSSMTPASAAPVLPDFAAIVSSQLIGSLLNFFFFGTLVIQVYVYRLCFPKDQFFVKLLVYFISLVMLVSTCLNAADVEFWYGAGFGDIARFADPRNSRLYTPMLGSLTAMLVQLFFCYRIVVIKRAAWPLVVLTALVSMAQCAGGLGGGAISYMKHNEVHDHQRTVLVYLWLAGGALADVVIAALMTTLLLHAAHETHLVGSTRGVVKNIVRLVIETNALSSVVAILGLVLFAGIPGTTYFVCPTMILPGIYANTLLVTLNNRAITRLESESSDGGPTSANNTFAFKSSTAHGQSRPSGASRSSAFSQAGVPPMSFAPREMPAKDHDDDEESTIGTVSGKGGAQEEKRARGSLERRWRDEEDDEQDIDDRGAADAGRESESEYEDEAVDGDHAGDVGLAVRA